MQFDREAAPIAAAATEHAREWRKATGRTLFNRDQVLAHLESAFIAGACFAKRDTVQATDALLDAMNGTRK